jgi:hypothetical protein
MKPFNLEAALKGAPVQTVEGYQVKLAGVAEVNTPFCLLGFMVDAPRCFLTAHSWTVAGKSSDPDYELIMAPVKKTGWLNIYRNGDTELWASQEEADHRCGIGRTACLYVEWME